MLRLQDLRANRFAHYTKENLQRDIMAGIVVGVIAIPLGMAFAIASGVKPEYGIYTTIIAGMLISIFGGSKYQIGGPTGAFVPILFGIVITYGFENLLIAGFLSGIILLLMGIFRLGSLIKYIPRPVTIGFTAGIAVVIFTGQIANFLGLEGVENQERFIDNLAEIWTHLHTVNIYSILTAVICLTIIMIAPKYFSRIPGPLLGLLISTIIAAVFYPNKVATIGSTFGGIPNTLPRFEMLDLSLDNIVTMLRPAFAIAILGAIESLLSAVVADEMTEDKHHSDRELLGQGIANMATPFFGGIPATGALARTAANIENGATSPMSGVVHSIVVLIVLLLFAPYASAVPLASMAPILMVVAWNMSQRREVAHIVKTKSGDSLVLAVTFILTIFANLIVAIEVGLIIAAALFVKRMNESLVTVKALPNHKHKAEKIDPNMVTENRDCPQISIYNIEGPLFFGTAMDFEEKILDTIKNKPKVFILRMGRVPHVDTTGEAHLSKIIHRFSRHGVVLITGIHEQPKSMLMKTGLYDEIGEENFFKQTGKAIKYALKLIDKEICYGCKHFAFKECKKLSCINAAKENAEQLA